jgi:hypothetical protein
MTALPAVGWGRPFRCGRYARTSPPVNALTGGGLAFQQADESFFFAVP